MLSVYTHTMYIIIGAVRIYFPEGTEQTISGPIKSWLRHASERSMKSKKYIVFYLNEILSSFQIFNH